MATKIIKAWINGAVQEIEVEDIVFPEQPLCVEERVDILEDKHEVVFTDGNLLVGNGTNDLEEMTPEEVLEHINGASVMTMTTEEFEALGEEETNANTLYMLTDDEDTSIQYTEQTLTDEQKAQARANIGAGTSDFGGSWNDLEDKPFYETGSLEVVVEEVTVSNRSSITPLEDFVEGETYTVVVDGVSYVDIYENDGIGGDPYSWEIMNLFGRISIYFVDELGSSEHTLVVYKGAMTVVTLDDKYISDNIARVEDIPEQVQADWSQIDDTQVDYIKNKPEIATDDEIIALLAQEDMLPVVADSDGSLLTDESNNILLW